MADKAQAGSAASGTAPAASGPAGVRNVVLVGPPGCGKTTLVERLLVATGTIARAGRVEDGTCVTDHDEAEIRHQRSVALAVAPFVHEGIKVNLLDTPGYADFVGDLRAGLRGADCALFVVAASEGIDGATRALWQECAAVGMPRALVVNKMDHQRADYDSVVAGAQAAFGDKVLELYLPLQGPDGAVTGLAGLLSQQVFDFAAGARSDRDPDDDERDRIESARGALLEGVIEESEDETLMDRYLEGEDIDYKVLVDDLEKAVAHASFFPILPVCALSGLGISELLEVMTSAFPSPFEHPLPSVFTIAGKAVAGLSCDPEGPLLAEVIKTTSDPYVGRISVVRVFSGTLRPELPVHVSGHFSAFFGAESGHADHDEDERIGSLSSPLGKTLRPVGACVAGDICAVAKLGRAETGDTLSDRDAPLLMEPWVLPEPLLPVAVKARAKADEDKLSSGLSRLAAEDPSLRVEHNAETGQLVLWCMGEAHADVLLDHLAHRYGVQVDKVDLRVPLRETFAEKASGHGRHVKQSGGHGQYAVCDIEVEPLESGAGFEFVDKVVGGAVPRQFIPSVEKGVRAQMQRGVTTSYPAVDLRVTLTDGKAHSVDSSDMAFQLAGGLALREAAARAQMLLLEPVDEISVLVDDEFVGPVMSDLSGRRAHVLGSEPVGSGGRTMVRALAPQLELTRYAIDLRSISHGTGTFSRSFVRYEPMPAHVAAKMKESAAS
ncbi:MAG TPA: elongation factor G-like protein EF-G2 [Nocardioidaceae bacterium]|nr:elongation factor G-like protein EF-G2 [Nocardioidaceae bacterium]